MTEEQQRCITVEEAAQKLGINKKTLYDYRNILNIELQTYPSRKKHAYIAIHDVERIAERRKEEQQRYITVEEAAKELELEKSTFHYYRKALNRDLHRVPWHDDVSVAKSDVERIRERIREEQQEHIPLHEAAKELGMKYGALFHSYRQALNITHHTHPSDNGLYITKSDIERIREKIREEQQNYIRFEQAYKELGITSDAFRYYSIALHIEFHGGYIAKSDVKRIRDEQQQYVSLEEATKKLGMDMSTLRYYRKMLDIKDQHVPSHKNVHITKGDVERIREEQQNYITLEEAAKELNMKKSDLPHCFGPLNIHIYHIPPHDDASIAKSDVERIREKEPSPWKVIHTLWLRQRKRE